MSSELYGWLVTQTAGYCGADLRAVCGEAALIAVRRRYPQIYQTTQRLMIDVDRFGVLHYMVAHIIPR